MITTEHKQKFKHKYNISDIVYYTSNHKVRKGTIEDVLFSTCGSILSVLDSFKRDISISYTVKYKMAGCDEIVTEDYCCDTIKGLYN